MSFYDLRFRSKQFPDGSLKNISSWYFLLFDILADFDQGQLYNICLMLRILTESETHNRKCL